MIEQLTCTRCNESWWPRSERLPKCCPRCKSPYWMRERVRAAAAVAGADRAPVAAAEADGPRYVTDDRYEVTPDY